MGEKQNKNNNPQIQELLMSIFHTESTTSRLTTAEFYLKQCKSVNSSSYTSILCHVLTRNFWHLLQSCERSI